MIERMVRIYCLAAALAIALAVSEAGYLEEYVVHDFGRDDWRAPAEIDLDAFRDWRRSRLRGHEPATRLIGSWGYGRAAMSR